MLIEISEWSEIDKRKLMNVYRKSNIENIKHFYPDAADRNDALHKVEHDYLEYIRNEFLDGRNRCMVFEHSGLWVSALRLYWIKDRLYYIEALETHPEYRQKGYASQLLSDVLNTLKKQGSFTVCDCVDKQNTASVAAHLKCGFVISSTAGYDYLQGKSDAQDYGMEFSYKA